MNYKDKVLETLRSMGFEPTQIGDAGYVFKYEEMNFLYMPEDNDENFLRISVPRIFDVTVENKVAVMEAIHDTTLKLKYVKANIMFEEAVWIMYEHYLVSNENIDDLIEHIINVLHAGVMVFHKYINGEEI